MVKYLEDLQSLSSHCRMDRRDIAAIDRTVEKQGAGEGVCVVGRCRKVAGVRGVRRGAVGGECGRVGRAHECLGEPGASLREVSWSGDGGR